MSPYIFVLCLDNLTHIITEEVEKNLWKPIRAGRSRPEVSHLMFADDLLLFGKATTRCVRSVCNAMNKFCSMSRQAVSLEKTSVLFSRNVYVSMRANLTQISGFHEKRNLGKYLGVPLTGKAPTRQDYLYLVDKVLNKLSGWKANNLSFAGRVTLSKFVI